MRYISHYEEYPIYEPAEGGYYYPGNQLIEVERKSKRQCRKEFEKIWKNCQKENAENGFIDGADWDLIIKNQHVYPWIRMNDNYIYKDGYYIGTGESYTIERKQGSQENSWKPFC